MTKNTPGQGGPYQHTAARSTTQGLRGHRARFATDTIWLSRDSKGFAAGDQNLYRYARNSPPNATDPSGLQEKQLGFQPTPYTKDPDSPGATYTDVLKQTLGDGKLGYEFAFNFTADRSAAAGRRYGLQALKSYFIVVGADGKVTRPSTADKDGYTLKIDQVDLANTVGSYTDSRRLVPPGGNTGGTVISPTGPKPAVFALQIIEAEAGLSGVNYRPLLDPPKKGLKVGDLRHNSTASAADYNHVAQGVASFSTKFSTIYVFYNPGNGKGVDKKFVFDAIDAAVKDRAIDADARKKVEGALKTVKTELGDRPFELLHFPEFFKSEKLGLLKVELPPPGKK